MPDTLVVMAAAVRSDLQGRGLAGVPGGLDVLAVDDDGIGTYTEPNVWMRHV